MAIQRIADGDRQRYPLRFTSGILSKQTRMTRRRTS